MTLLLDPRQPVPFRPAWPKSNDVYLLQLPRNLDDPAFRRALSEAGARWWTDVDLLSTLANGLRQLAASGEDAVARDRAVEIVSGYGERLNLAARRVASGEWDHLSEAERDAAFLEAAGRPAEIDAIQQIGRDHIAAYRAMEADRAVFVQIRGQVAARMFLIGWEGCPVPFRRSWSGVPDDILELIHPGHLLAIGQEIERLRTVTRERGKGLGSQSGGQSPSPATSSTPPSSSGTETSMSAPPLDSGSIGIPSA